jgi:hypothetical protein
MMCCSSVLTAPKLAMEHVTKVIGNKGAANSASQSATVNFGGVSRKLMSSEERLRADQSG